MKGLQIHVYNLSVSLYGILGWRCHVWHNMGCSKTEIRQEYQEELRECWNSGGIDVGTNHGQVWFDQGTCQKGAGNRSQVELPRKAGEITGNCTWRSNHWSHLIMKIDISCLELLLMSLESGVCVTLLAAVLSEAAQHLTEVATSLKPWVPDSVRKSYNLRNFSHFLFTPEISTLLGYISF